MGHMTESVLKDALIGFARARGWLVHHDLPAVNRRGRWATHIQGDAGFPDLVLVHPSGDLVIAELKADNKYPTKLQTAWLDAMRRAGLEVHIWRPEDWKDGTIVTRLLRPTTTR
jgi:hypothetical protein